MSIDLTKLTPAPWEGQDRRFDFWPKADAAFCAMARNAFDVMKRRGWGVQLAYFRDDGTSLEDPLFRVIAPGTERLGCRDMPRHHADPFTALVEADAWYKANVENATP